MFHMRINKRQDVYTICYTTKYIIKIIKMCFHSLFHIYLNLNKIQFI